jgi:glycosyltransferase involved in cell wall biosynthesis
MASAAGAHPPPGRVSVVIPVRNGADYIGEQFEALASQTYRGAWEVVVADNGSTDATLDVAREWSSRLPCLRVVDASQRPGSSYARNRGAQEATGDYLAFCDADDVVAPQWLAALVASAPRFDALTGPQDVTVINEPAVQQWRPPRAAKLPRGGFLPYAPSCNLGVWADVFAKTGGFSEDYPQAHDVDWAWRLQLASFTLGFEPDAVVHYRYRTSPRGVARQGYVSGVDGARLYRDYRRLGMNRPRLTRAVRTWMWLVVRLPYLASAEKRGIWLRRAGEAAGRVSGSVQFRVVFL